MIEPAHPHKTPWHTPTEPGVLQVSIAATVVVAALGIVFGLLSGSYAIVFDGIYSLADGVTSVAALLVAKLIASYNASDGSRRLVEKFTMGFWHMEPMVVGAAGLLMSGAAVYAFINAIGSFLSGGRPLAFGQAIVYAVVVVVISLVMTLYGLYANRRLRSELVAMDVRGWVMSTAIGAALLVAFVIGLAIQGTPLEWMSPYVDPTVLALVCVAVFPIPLRAMWQALEEVMLVTPVELKRHVDEVAQRVVERHGFTGYRAYVAKVGRGRQIELYFIAPAGWPARTLEAWDGLRDEIGAAIGTDTPDLWLTIAFTTDHEWAE